MSEVPSETEAVLRRAWDAQDFATVATVALRAYGAEIHTFLSSRLRANSDADEVFAMFAEDMWKGIPGFGFRCSLRGWLYAIARNTANRYTTSPHRRRARNIPLSQGDVISALVEQVRSATQRHQRTDAKDSVRALRESLSPDDQMLLTLHVDRSLPWREIAMVMHEQSTELENAELEREAARLRKRFERVKQELKRLATDVGLIRG